MDVHKTFVFYKTGVFFRIENHVVVEYVWPLFVDNKIFFPNT